MEPLFVDYDFGRGFDSRRLHHRFFNDLAEISPCIVQRGMALNLYRRHWRDCKAGHQESSFSGGFEERRKGWKRCDCPIAASGTFQKRVRRQSTGAWDWDAAKEIVAGWEQSGSWGTAPATAVPAPEQREQAKRITIAEATSAFLDRIRAKGFEPATESKYRTFIKQFRAFADGKGYICIDQLTISTWIASMRHGQMESEQRLFSRLA